MWASHGVLSAPIAVCTLQSNESGAKQHTFYKRPWLYTWIKKKSIEQAKCVYIDSSVLQFLSSLSKKRSHQPAAVANAETQRTAHSPKLETDFGLVRYRREVVEEVQQY